MIHALVFVVAFAAGFLAGQDYERLQRERIRRRRNPLLWGLPR